MDDYMCNICNKQYSSYKSLWNHNKDFHKINNDKKINLTHNNTQIHTNNTQLPQNNTQIQKNKCLSCNKIFSRLDSLKRHEKTCKIVKENNIIKKKELEKEQKELEKEQKELEKEQKELAKIEMTILKLKLKIKSSKKQAKINKEKIELAAKLAEIDKKNKIELSNIIPINNQLINLIVNKTNTIEELKTKIDENKIDNNSQIEINNNTQLKQKQQTLKLNDVVVISRSEDNYINATQLCQAGDKLFADWYRLNTTKQLLNEAESDMGIHISQLIDIKKGNSNEFQQGTWIHPDLAIQLAQWISPQFALQVSKWIRTLFTTGNITIDIQLLEDKNKEIMMKDNKIKLLEDLYVKKQQRKDYPEKNVIYILTTEDNKKKRIYIIGKAKELKNRLSTYNKTSEHEVVYYKSCKSEEDMNVIEVMVINKLKEYKEKANRDRFILPIEKDISLFTNVIESCINFY